MSITKIQNAAAVIASLFILLFLYTAISKLSERHHFATIMGRSPLLKNLNVFLSWAIPVSELIVAVLLFFPPSRHWGLFFSFLLMTVFTIYIGYMLATASYLPCSCGGIFRKFSWKSHLFLNIFLSILSFAGWRLEKRFNALLINRRS